MLNPFYIYNIITIFVCTLYILPVSEFNTNLDIFLIILIISSLIISLILGNIYKQYFQYHDAEENLKKGKYIPLIIIVFLSIFEFWYTKDIPFFSTTINGIKEYKEFESIPFLHMFTAMLSMYYSIVYIYHAISYETNRKLNILSYFLINLLMILFNMRSFFMINVFTALNILIAKLRSNGKIKSKYYVLFLLISICILYLFGCFGNKRQGYDWNDNNYIEALGLYYAWPSKIPKQYMWSYSYITSPLANLNYNIKNNNNSFNIINTIYEIIPVSISKRLPFYKDKHDCILIKPYFNVSTGYCNSYTNGGYIGMIFIWSFIMILSIFTTKYANDCNKKQKYMLFIALLDSCIAFMFFTNTFSYGGTAPALWFSTFMLISRIKIIK